MENLAQLRARHAVDWAPNVKAGKGDGSPSAVVKKVPAQIIQNGLLGALAFALEDNPGHLSVFRGAIKHLAEIRQKGFDLGIAETDPERFFSALCAASSNVLRAVTAETMAYLEYLRRFVKK